MENLENPQENIKPETSWIESYKRYSKIFLFSILTSTVTASAEEPREHNIVPVETIKKEADEVSPIVEKTELTNLYEKLYSACKNKDFLIPDVESVRFYNPEKFKKVIFYIRTHHLPFLYPEQFENEDIDQQKEYLELTQKCGNEVSNILDWLHKETQTENIYAEGLVEAQMEDFHKAWKDDLTSDKTVATLVGPWIDRTHNTGDKIPFKLLRKYRLATPDGVMTLKPWAKIHAGEKEETRNENTHEAALRINQALGQDLEPNPSDTELIYGAREDSLLSLIKEDRAFTIFGGAHDFVDNVKKHNKNNPEEQIAIVTITPHSVKKVKFH